MSTCSKALTMTVNATPAGPDWASLVWAVENIGGTETWNAVASDTGDEVDFEASCGYDVDGQSSVVFSYSAGEFSVGTGIIWAGGAVNCNLHINEIAGADVGDGGRTCEITVYLDGIQITSGSPTFVTGFEQDVPFTIPASGVITCLIQMSANTGSNNPGDEKLTHFIATFTNV